MTAEVVTLSPPCGYNPPAVMRPADQPPSDDSGADDFVVDNAMLTEALTKARRLVAELERQQAEIEASPPNLPADQLAQGKFAFDNALASARRMLKALEDAAAIAHSSFDPHHDPN